jgi:RES domain-containing protein
MILYSIQRYTYREQWPLEGWKHAEGRWNRIGQPIIYTAPSVSLAKLEILANNPTRLGRRVVIQIDLDDDAPVKTYEADNLPLDWYLYPYPDGLNIVTRQFLSGNRYIAMRVPSAQSFGEHNYLLNAGYPNFKEHAHHVAWWEEHFDPRLRGE